jgi:two-component system CheB/CheR fusion protein
VRSPEEPSGGRRVLVVEDHADSAESLVTLLELAGYVAASALDGAAGVDAAGAFRPDVVLVDLGLPVLDGYEVARRLRASPDGGRLVLVALTGHGDAEDRERSSQAGFDHHLVKPVQPERLLDLLSQPR